MGGTGDRDFAWAKACGILGGAFIGSRVKRLYPVSRLSELDRLVFPEAPSDLPERKLSVLFERKVSARAARRVVSLVSLYDRPPAAVVRLVRAYEYADLSRVLAALSAGDDHGPEPVPIGPFRTLRFDAYPDLARMTAGTECAWVAAAHASAASAAETESELDRRYYRLLWDEISELPRRDRSVFERLAAEEIVLKNIVWALRLRVYYGISGEDLARRLLDIPWRGRSLAAEALETEAFALDRREDWARWRRRELLAGAGEGDAWEASPRLVQNEAARRLYRLSRALFRFNPGDVGAVACFAKLAQFEEDLLTSVAEGLSLGQAPREVVEYLGASA